MADRKTCMAFLNNCQAPNATPSINHEHNVICGFCPFTTQDKVAWFKDSDFYKVWRRFSDSLWKLGGLHFQVPPTLCGSLCMSTHALFRLLLTSLPFLPNKSTRSSQKAFVVRDFKLVMRKAAFSWVVGYPWQLKEVSCLQHIDFYFFPLNLI